MIDEWEEKATEVCKKCGGRCCMDAHPPLTDERIRILADNDVPEDNIEFAGYKRLKVKADNMCVMFGENGLCAIHAFKPETCVAGPFTFDVKEGIIEIFLKKESICPWWRCSSRTGRHTTSNTRLRSTRSSGWWRSCPRKSSLRSAASKSQTPTRLRN